MDNPEFLKSFTPSARKLIAQGRVRDIEFSGGTYQVQVIDPKQDEELWAFLQLDSRGQIKDAFCSCETSEDGSACVHIAAAFLKIYAGQASPLHQRFERSLWNKLFRLYSDRMGQNPDLLKQPSKGHYTCKSVGEKSVFFVTGKTAHAQGYLKELIRHRKAETEETSLKFSNLPPEELTLWREGRPSSQLAYELSFWSDLAKWILRLQEEEHPYQIAFEYSPKGIPNFLRVGFADVEMGFYLSEANLPALIPALAQVKSPLKVHSISQDTISKVTYAKEEGCLYVQSKEAPPLSNLKHKKGIPLGSWLFVPRDGFYIRGQHSLLSTPRLCGEQVDQALKEYSLVIRSLLEGYKVQLDPVARPPMRLLLMPIGILHITCYLFTPGDFTQPYSRIFGEWVFLDDEGFYRLENAPFQGIETVVPVKEVPEFIRQHRTWLNTQEGFQTHLASVEAQMGYRVSDEGYLSFEQRLSPSEENSQTKEFGAWIYVSQQGFYSKVQSQMALPIRPGLCLTSRANSALLFDE